MKSLVYQWIGGLRMSKELSKKAKEKKAEYMKEYRSRPGKLEKQKEYVRNYWERKANEDMGEK